MGKDKKQKPKKEPPAYAQAQWSRVVDDKEQPVSYRAVFYKDSFETNDEALSMAGKLMRWLEKSKTTRNDKDQVEQRQIVDTGDAYALSFNDHHDGTPGSHGDRMDKLTTFLTKGKIRFAATDTLAQKAAAAAPEPEAVEPQEPRKLTPKQRRTFIEAVASEPGYAPAAAKDYALQIMATRAKRGRKDDGTTGSLFDLP